MQGLRRRRGFPTDFPLLGCRTFVWAHVVRRGFPTDFPLLGCLAVDIAERVRRGFPTDFPLLGYTWQICACLRKPWFPY